MKELELLIMYHKTTKQRSRMRTYPAKGQTSRSLRAQSHDEGSCCALGCAAESRGYSVAIQYGCEGMQPLPESLWISYRRLRYNKILTTRASRSSGSEERG
jgi:hypothetical protein